MIRNRVLIKAGKALIEQIGAQLLFEPSKRPAFEIPGFLDDICAREAADPIKKGLAEKVQGKCQI